MTVDEALARARERGVDRLDAQLLLARQLARPRTWLIAHGDQTLSEPQSHAFRALVDRRANGEPLAYLIGEREFHGLTLAVDAGVLVPRPDTETLVDWGLELLRGPLAGGAAPCVVDLGTGSGAIALAIQRCCPAARVAATDTSPTALQIARSNAERLGLPVVFRPGDWWGAVSGDRFDLALSNPPYIAEADEHLTHLSHEPRSALVAGPQGLEAIERIVAGAGSHLRPSGWLLLEHGHDQACAVRALLHATGFTEVQSRRDLAGIERCTGARQF